MLRTAARRGLLLFLLGLVDSQRLSVVNAGTTFEGEPAAFGIAEVFKGLVLAFADELSLCFELGREEGFSACTTGNAFS